ncbi:hypothetical protein POUND7_008415 [Theobroma cacao]
MFVVSNWINCELEIESDSFNVVKWVQSPLQVPWRLTKPILQISNLLRNVQDWRIILVFRSANVEADSLAKSGC